MKCAEHGPAQPNRSVTSMRESRARGAELTKSTYINRHDDQKKESFKMRASTALVIVGRAEAEAPRAHKPH